MTARACSAIAAAVLFAACGSVPVPPEQYYRLEPPPLSAPDPQRGGVLRVHDLALQTALDSDCLQRLDGVRLQPRASSRWVAPLDRLVTDALVLGLSRARVCELVKAAADPGDETWTLRGRIVDFVEVAGGAGGDGDRARVTLELWLQADDRVLFHDEFAHEEAVAPGGDAATVQALSRGLGRVVADVVARMRAQDLFAAARTAGPAPRAAGPSR